MTRTLSVTGAPSRVLIVDDDRQNRKVLEMMLSHEGFHLITSESGAEAIVMIENSPPDLILLDVLMPGMDGYDVTRWVKSNNATKNIPVIMVTARDDREARMKGLLAGAEDFLAKPVDRAELCARVRNLLRLKSYGDFYGRYSEALETEVDARISEIRTSEQFLRSTIDALPLHVGIIGPEGILVTVNERWRRFSRENGGAATFVDGVNYLSVSDSHAGASDEARNASKGIRSVIAGDVPEFQMEYPCHSPSEKRWFSMRVSPFDDVRPARVVITHSNVTERKNMEAQLLHKQKLESMGQLAGGVAHDFNNILTVIKSYSDILLTELDIDPEHRRDIEEINRAADRATHLTQQLLAFSRKDTVSPKVFDLNRQLVGVQSMLGRLIGEDVELVVTLQAGELPIRVDPMHLEQVVVNLVVNARDAMPSGGVLTLETNTRLLGPNNPELGLELSPGEHVVLSVCDTGEGMTPDTMLRIFEPFYTTKSEGKGTGLGLSTVFGIVNQAGGSVRVASVLGNGTTFTLYFPMDEMSLEADIVPHPPTGVAAESARILFVEDETALRTLASRILTKHGFYVRVASGCEEALKICAETETPFDLACIDVVMPGMGGGELSLKLLEENASLKILMMSGFNDDELLRRGIGDNTVPFIQKPYSPVTLVAKIREVLAAGALQSSPYLRLA